MVRNTKKHEKLKNAHCSTWNMLSRIKIMENEKHILQDLEYGKKH